MPEKLLAFLRKETTHLSDAGLLRSESVIGSPQEEKISVRNRELINLASANYLGLADHRAIKAAAKKAIDEYGVGVASPRAPAGTQAIHTELEHMLASFFATEDALLFPSAYHANTGLFESLLSEQDYVFCDAQCHPSIADGLRLCRARVFLYRNNDLGHLEDRLKRSRAARFRVVVSDGVFSLDGVLAHLDGICDLASKYDALVVVDDAHGIGVLGRRGRGTAEHLEVADRVDLLSGTFGNALGGGGGGFACGRQAIITWLRQKSRPYLISTALSPASAGAGLRALELVDHDIKPRERLRANVSWFRRAIGELGFDIIESIHPMVVVRVGEAVTAQKMVDKLHNEGIFCMGFCYPVVPEGEARVRVQLSTLHGEETLTRITQAFARAGRELRLI